MHRNFCIFLTSPVLCSHALFVINAFDCCTFTLGPSVTEHYDLLLILPGVQIDVLYVCVCVGG